MDLVANVLTMKAVLGEKLTVFGGEQWRPLLHVQDVGTAVEYGLKNEISPVEMLNIANASASLVVSKLSNRYPNIDEVKKVIHKNSKI